MDFDGFIEKLLRMLVAMEERNIERYKHLAFKEHFDAGRRIPEWLLAAGYDVVAWDPRVLANADATGDTFHGHTWKTYRRLLERLGTVSVEDLDHFDRLCDETTAAGTFTFTVTRHAWLARTAGGTT